jgi:hypothetical protein
MSEKPSLRTGLLISERTRDYTRVPDTVCRAHYLGHISWDVVMRGLVSKPPQFDLLKNAAGSELPAPIGIRRREPGELRDLLDFTVADTRCADPHPAPGAFHQGPNRLQIHIPAPLRNVVGVADPVTELRSPPAYFANLCHKTKISVAFETPSIPTARQAPQPVGYHPAPLLYFHFSIFFRISAAFFASGASSRYFS